MNELKKEALWVNAALFNDNVNKFPAEELMKYVGRHVAWNLDGTRILASGRDETEMENNLRELGIDPSCVVGSFIPNEDSFLGGWIYNEDSDCADRQPTLPGDVSRPRMLSGR